MRTGQLPVKAILLHRSPLYDVTFIDVTPCTSHFSSFDLDLHTLSPLMHACAIAAASTLTTA